MTKMHRMLGALPKPLPLGPSSVWKTRTPLNADSNANMISYATKESKDPTQRLFTTVHTPSHIINGKTPSINALGRMAAAKLVCVRVSPG